MGRQNSLIAAHLQGEDVSALVSWTDDALLSAMAVDTVGRRFQVEWDPQAPVTPLGQLVFFCQFLAAGGLYSNWVAECPLRYSSPNAPSLKDLLGTWVLATLSGAWRYAHVTALRGDRVKLSLFLSGLINAAEQLQPQERWRRIWRRILEPYRLPTAAWLAPSG